jgi:hypothetical protein
MAEKFNNNSGDTYPDGANNAILELKILIIILSSYDSFAMATFGAVIFLSSFFIIGYDRLVRKIL